MRTIKNVFLIGRTRAVAIGVVVLLASATMAATASAIDMDGGDPITATSLGRLAFTGLGIIDIIINCNVVLNGTFAEDIAQSAGAHMGDMTGGSARECDAGAFIVLFGSPRTWEIRFTSMNLASSPRLLTAVINNVQIAINSLGQDCLYTGSVSVSVEFDGTGTNPGTSNLLRILPGSISLSSGDFFCPSIGQLAGTMAISPELELELV